MCLSNQHHFSSFYKQLVSHNIGSVIHICHVHSSKREKQTFMSLNWIVIKKQLLSHNNYDFHFKVKKLNRIERYWKPKDKAWKVYIKRVSKNKWNKKISEACWKVTVKGTKKVIARKK